MEVPEHVYLQAGSLNSGPDSAIHSLCETEQVAALGVLFLLLQMLTILYHCEIIYVKHLVHSRHSTFISLLLIRSGRKHIFLGQAHMPACLIPLRIGL